MLSADLETPSHSPPPFPSFAKTSPIHGSTRNCPWRALPFRPGPSFELTLRQERFMHGRKILAPYQCYRSPSACVVAPESCLMLYEPPVNVGGLACVDRDVTTSKHVHVVRHSSRCHELFESAISQGKLQRLSGRCPNWWWLARCILRLVVTETGEMQSNTSTTRSGCGWLFWRRRFFIPPHLPTRRQGDSGHAVEHIDDSLRMRLGM